MLKITNNNSSISEQDRIMILSQYDRLMTLFESEIKGLKRENYHIGKIIDDEIGSYLSGQKSADEIIDIIENRIAIYLAEQG